MIDLKATFGKRYRIYHDPSWDEETSEIRTHYRKTGVEAWYYELRGPNCTIFPYSPSAVGVRWIGRGNKALFSVATRIKPLDGEILYIIPNLALKGVLDAVKVRRVKQVTEAMRARGKALAARYGFGR